MNDLDKSILQSIKKLLGITSDYTHFDSDIVIYINSVFMDLHQLGIGPDDGFSITDKTSNWEDFIPAGNLLNAVKTYVYLKVKFLFDPPANSSAVEALERQINRLEWRLNVEVDPIKNEGGDT